MSIILCGVCRFLGFPPSNRFLNSKERKLLLQSLRSSFGVDDLPDGVYIQNAKDKVFLLNRDIDRVDFEKLFIDSAGLYIGTWQVDGFRLSTEGAQLFASRVVHDIVDLDDVQRSLWLKGEDLVWPLEDTGRFVIVRHGMDVLGSGRVRAPRQGEQECVLLNYTPKARRLVVINE